MINYPAWKNGTYCQVKDLTISVLDLGFIHCDATYDVISVVNGNTQNLEAHMNRFKKSAEGWRLPLLYTTAELILVINELIKNSETKNLLVWIGLTRGIPKSGSPRDLANCTPNIFAYTKPYFGFNSSNTATVCLANTVLRTPDISINQVHKNFAWNDLTKAQWEAIDRGYDTAILKNHSGFITEGPGFNVGIIVGENILSPKSNRLQGTVMDLIQKSSTKFNYTDIAFSDIMTADAMFLTSTAGNVIRVTNFEDKEFKENKILSWLMSNI